MSMLMQMLRNRAVQQGQKPQCNSGRRRAGKKKDLRCLNALSDSDRQFSKAFNFHSYRSRNRRLTNLRAQCYTNELDNFNDYIGIQIIQLLSAF